MLSVAEALERVLSGVPALGTESVTLGEARARVLAEPVVAEYPHATDAATAAPRVRPV